jgi:hypothetical protein
VRRPADDDLEPIPLADTPPSAPPAPPDDAPSRAAAERPTVVRDRFLLALAVVVAVALIALAVQLRAIARDTAHDADCSEALVAIVSSPSRTGADLRARIEAQLQACLGPDATLPGGSVGS